MSSKTKQKTMINIKPFNYNNLPQNNVRKNLRKPSFGINMIDAHVHISPPEHEKTFHWIDLGKNSLLCAININGAEGCPDKITGAIVSNIRCIDTKDGNEGGDPKDNETHGNLDTFNLCETDKKLFPAAVCQPGHGNPKDIEKLISEKKFYALKFHPYYLGEPANSELYDPYLDIAKKQGLPCVFHTAPGSSAPNLVYELAKRHPDVPIILYHSNLGSNSWDAINVVKKSLEKKDANLYLELSWVDQDVNSNIIIDMINEVGAKRVLFGTDAPIGCDSDGGNVNYARRINNIKRLIYNNYSQEEANKITKQVFYENSKELFKIDDEQSESKAN